MARTISVTGVTFDTLSVRRIDKDDSTIDVQVTVDYQANMSDGTKQLQTQRDYVANLTLPTNPTVAQAKNALETLLAFERNRIRTREGLP